MRRGDLAAAAGDYDQARRAYGFAFDTKSSDAALAGMKAAQAASIGAQLDAAAAAIKEGRHVEADRLLRDVELFAPDDPRLATLRTEARASMMAAVTRQMEQEGADRAQTYELVMAARRMYPGEPDAEVALATLRERYVADAKSELEADRYAEARDIVALIAKMEPWQTSLTDKLDHEITTEWADSLVARAKGNATKRPGLASVLYARAYEIAARPADLEASRARFEEAADKALLEVFIDSGSESSRGYAMRKASRAAIADDPGVTAGTSSRWDMSVKVYAADPRCVETKQAEHHTKDYIAGQKEVTNPAHTAAKTQVAEATKAHDAAKVAAAEALARQEATAKVVRDTELEKGVKQRALEDASAMLAMYKSQLERSTAEVKTTEAELAGLPADATSQRAAVSERLGVLKGYVADWTAKVEKDGAAEAKAREAFQAVETKLAAAKTEAEKAAADATSTEATRAAARQSLTDSQTRLAAISPTMMEDIPKTLEYDIVTWTNTCTEKVTAYVGSNWSPKPESPFSFTVTRSVTDTAQIGHEKAGLVEDPKAYPKSNADLLAELDTESQQKLDAMIVGVIDGYFASTVAKALEAADVDASTDVLASLYAGAPTRMDEAARGKFVQQMKDAYGLEKLESFAPEPPPPPAVAEPPAAAQPQTGTTDKAAAASPTPAEG